MNLAIGVKDQDTHECTILLGSPSLWSLPSRSTRTPVPWRNGRRCWTRTFSSRSALARPGRTGGTDNQYRKLIGESQVLTFVATLPHFLHGLGFHSQVSRALIGLDRAAQNNRVVVPDRCRNYLVLRTGTTDASQICNQSLVRTSEQ